MNKRLEGSRDDSYSPDQFRAEEEAYTMMYGRGRWHKTAAIGPSHSSQ